MKDETIPEELRKHEIARCVTVIKGGGDLPKISVKTEWSTAEVYLLGARGMEILLQALPRTRRDLATA